MKNLVGNNSSFEAIAKEEVNMYVYIVWEKDTGIEEEVFSDVFANKVDADIYLNKLENEEFTYGFITRNRVK